MFTDLALPVLMGVLFGASAHRAGLCTVTAVAQVMTTRRAHVLWSFLKTSLRARGLLPVAPLGVMRAPGARVPRISCEGEICGAEV